MAQTILRATSRVLDGCKRMQLPMNEGDIPSKALLESRSVMAS